MKPGRMNKHERAYIRMHRRRQNVHKNSTLKKAIFMCVGFLHYVKKSIITLITYIQKYLISLMQKIKKNVDIHLRKKNLHTRSTTPNTKISKNNLKKSHLSIIKKIIVAGVCIMLVLAGVFFIWMATLEIPDVGDFGERKISNSTKIYDRTGEILLYDIHENIQRTVISFNDINQYSKDAIVAIEDHTFYEHKGVVWKSTLRAVVQTIASKIGLSSAGSAGGSTLTQQVVKNTLLTREQTITRKVKEWVLAYKLEQQLTKEEILAVYLNEAPYGGTIYGIEEAANNFFGKSALDITLAESAYLAAIPNLPTYYSPYGQNKADLDRRQRTVLGVMKQYGYISDVEYREALDEVVVFLPQDTHDAKSLHFVQYIREQLEETYGIDEVENGGLRVVTTLDYRLQQEAERIIREHIDEVEDLYNASNAALVAIESRTGHIISMVGSRDYFDTEGFDGNFNVVLAKRQPGSSFKPFAYAAAFEKGYTPESAIFDTQTQFNSSCDMTDMTSENGCYSPNNYDFDFKGPLTWRDALAQSRNIPAIKVLYLAGIENVIRLAQDMGITSLNQRPSYYGLGLVLGGGEVSLLEMVGAYSSFSNNGSLQKINSILEVTDANGVVLEKYTPKEERIFSQNTAAMISSILSDNAARAPLLGSNSFLYFGGIDVAGKTGTTNDNRDAWLVGYTSEVTLGVWTGNNDNSPMKKGSTITGKPWRAFMDQILKEYPAQNFSSYSPPANFESFPNMVQGEWRGGTSVYIDAVSKQPATESTPADQRIRITEPDPHTILHWIDKDNPSVLNTGQNDIQYKNWEYGVQQYIQSGKLILGESAFEIPEPNGEGGEETFSDAFDFTVKNVFETPYTLEDTITIEINLDDRDASDVDTIEYRINNVFAGLLESFSNFSFKPKDAFTIDTVNTLSITITDNDGNRVTRDIEFMVTL